MRNGFGEAERRRKDETESICRGRWPRRRRSSSVGGVALAAANDGDRTTRCEACVARIAERRGVTVDQLEANVKARLLARIDAAEKAGRISSARATNLRERVSEGSLCGAAAKARVKFAARGMLPAAARFLGLDRAELRAQLPGTLPCGTRREAGQERLGARGGDGRTRQGEAGERRRDGKLTKERAQAVLDRLEQPPASRARVPAT